MKKKLYFIKIINAIQQGGNKFILVVSLIMGIAISNFANAQWYWQHPLPQGNNLNDLHVFSENNLIIVGDVGTVLRTLDGGLSWQKNNLDGNLNAIDFINSTTGFILGDSGIYKTWDGGIIWNKIANVGGTDLQMITENIGIITQLKGNFPWQFGKILKTTDGGYTWSVKYQEYRDWYSVYFVNENVGWCSGFEGILKTTNSGENWTYVPIFDREEINDIYFINASTGWALAPSSIWKSTNGGENWDYFSYPGGGRRGKIYFISELLGWAVDKESPFISRTTDGGNTWNNLYDNSGQGLISLTILTSNIGFAVGTQGRILKTINSGVSQVHLDNTNSNYINSIKMFDGNFGYAVGDKILKTTDGGNNWDISGSSNGHFYDIEIVNQNIAYSVGGNNLKTTNGGISWFEFNSGLSAGNVFDAYFINENLGWWVGELGSIIKTTDGGNTFIIQKQTGIPQDYIFSIDMLNENVGYCLEDEDGYYLRVLKTTNGGNNWNVIYQTSIYSPGFRPKIIFKDNNIGYITGYPELLMTTNGGLGWNSISGMSFVRDVSFSSDLNGYLVATHAGFGSFGKLFETTNGGYSWNDKGFVYGGPLLSAEFKASKVGWVAGGNAILKASFEATSIELISPSNNQTINTEEINCQWSDVSAQYYRIMVDNNSGLGSKEIYDSVTTTSHTIPGYFLEANTYYWKVIAYFSDGSSIESDVSYFHYDPPKLQAPYWIPFYRLYKAEDKDHFYCTTQEQRSVAADSGYVEEGIEGHISAKPFDHPDMKNIFRLYSDQNKAHFYTTDGNEKDIKIQEGYTYEGIVGFSYANQLPDLVPMYRLKKDFGGTPPNIDYFCTISWAERKYAEDNYGFTYDSIMTYVSPNNGKMTEPLALGQMMAALGVNTQNGNFQSPVIKSFNIADKGISLNFSHFYNSLSAVLFTDRKPLGPGWTHTYNAYITYSDPNEVNSLFNIIWPDGNIHTYYKEGSNYSCTTPGIYDSIDVVNFPLHIKIIKKDQTVYEFKTPTGALWGSPALLTSITDKNGNILSCQYNVVNQMAINLSNVTGTTGRNLTFTYYTEAGKEDLIKTVQDPAGRTINFEYDTLGNLIRFIDAENKLYNYEYNSPYQQDRLMTKFIFPNGNFIENIYDTTSVNSSNVKYVADQIDGSTSSKFEIRFYNSTPGSPYSTVKDPNGEIWKYTSNANNIIQQAYNNTLVYGVDFEWLDSNNPTLPTRITDGRGNSTSYIYDLMGNVLTISQPLGVNHLFTYDAKNNLTKYKNPRGFDFDYSYDGSSNLTTIATPVGITTLNYLTSSGGLVQSIQNPLSQFTSFAYNQYGNIITVTDPLSNITSYDYDGISRLINVTNAKMQVTSYTYDNRDLIRFVNDPAGQTSYTYDDNSNLRTVTNAKGQITTLNYDPLTDWLISTQNNAGNQTTFGYYPNGLLSSKIDAMTNTTNYYYDQASRLSNIISPSRTATMIYDNNSNLTGLTDNAKNMYFTYDALNRLQNYTDYYGNITTYTYDDAGNVERINYNPGNKTVQYNYDGDNRLTSVTDWNGKQTSYTYRADGTIQQIAYPNSVISSYNYDNASRITGISTTGPSGTIAQYSFTLDALGNHTQENIEQPLSPVPNLFEQSISYTYDLANRIQSAGNMNYTFDANGNLSTRTESGTATSYTFNTENLLTGINNDQASFIYDVFGNRREATRSGVNRRYVLDINGPMSQVLVETDENNNPINYYVYGLGLVSRIKPDGTTHCYHGDFRGSVVAMANSVGTVTHRYSYDVFGNLIDQVEPDYNPFKYVGTYGVMEETHGLQFMRARYYDPEIGRFISEDPVWDVNLFSYSNNNPITAFDADGLENKNLEEYQQRKKTLLMELTKYQKMSADAEQLEYSYMQAEIILKFIGDLTSLAPGVGITNALTGLIANLYYGNEKDAAIYSVDLLIAFTGTLSKNPLAKTGKQKALHRSIFWTINRITNWGLRKTIK